MWEAEGTKLQNICFRLQFLKFFFFGSLPSPRAGVVIHCLVNHWSMLTPLTLTCGFGLVPRFFFLKGNITKSIA